MKKVLLTIGALLPLISFGQVFSAGFETNNGPLTNWTLYNVDALTPNTNVNYVTNAWIANAEEFGNNVAMSTSWYTPAGTSNDWMVSPAITLPAGTNTLYWHARSYDATYKESYKVYISTTGNTVADFSLPALTVNLEETAWQNKSLDLSLYAGQTIYIAFQNFSNDAFLGAIDNVYVANGTVPQPGRVMTTSNVTTGSTTLNWTAATGVTGYDYSVGAVGVVPSVTGSVTGAASNTANVGSLAANTMYDYYVRSKNNTLNSAWIGPYKLHTAQAMQVGNYAYGFDNSAAGFYQNDGWTGAWSTNNTAGNPQAGTQMVFSNSSTTVGTPTNRWLFSKPFELSVGYTYSVSFYLRRFGAANPQSIALKVGNNNTTAAQTTTLWSSSTQADATWTMYTTNFTPTSTGTYYFSFHHSTPGIAGAVSLALDTFSITGTLGTNEVSNAENLISVYPNPTSDFLNIKAKDKIKNVSVYDLSGKNVRVDISGNTVNVKHLQSGTYMITVETANGKVSEKFIKK